MKLYHYSKDLYDVLKTKAAVGGLTKEQIKESNDHAIYRHDPGAYIDHISFLFDPIPLKLLGEIYEDKNPVWFNGNKLNEYIVDTSQFEKDILYRIVETPACIKMLDSITGKDWENDSFKRNYFKQRYDTQIELSEIGNSKFELEKQITKFHGKTEHFYLLASKRKDFQDNITKYAANVPHVKLYPKFGIVKISSVSKVVIGEDRNRQPIYSKWK